MKEYASKLKHTKFPIHETVTAALMVNSMPDSYDNVTSTLRQDSLLIADVKRRFLMEDRHCINRTGNGGVNNVLIGCSSSNLYCTNCKRTSQEYKDCWSSGGGAKGKGPKCRGRKKKDQTKAANNNSDKVSKHSMYIVERALYSNSVSAYVAGVISPVKYSITPEENSALVARLGKVHNIIVDSGLTLHIHPFLKDFSSLNVRVTSIEGLNGSLGQGTLSILTKRNSNAPKLLHFRNALCTPGAQISLISVSRLAKAGHRVTFDDDYCKILDKKTEKIVATTTMQDLLYHLDISDISEHWKHTTILSRTLSQP